MKPTVVLYLYAHKTTDFKLTTLKKNENKTSSKISRSNPEITQLLNSSKHLLTEDKISYYKVTNHEAPVLSGLHNIQ